MKFRQTYIILYFQHIIFYLFTFIHYNFNNSLLNNTNSIIQNVKLMKNVENSVETVKKYCNIDKKKWKNKIKYRFFMIFFEIT